MDYKELRLTGSPAPHIRAREGTRHIMGEVLTALLPALGFAVYSFGWRPLVNTLVSVLGCVIFELLYRAVLKKSGDIGDLSAVVTGVLIAFICPVTIPYWLLLTGDFFAIIAVKQLFGGVGKNFLNPALAARAFVFSWAKMTWVGPRTAVPLWGAVDAVSSPTPMALLHEGGLERLQEAYSLPEMLVGLVGGCIGEVSALMLLIGGVFLIIRRIITWHIPVSYLGTVALLTFLFPRSNDPVQWMLCNLLGGGLLLGAIFMATDYVTSPISRAGQLIYGAGCGVLTVLIRYFGPCGEGVCYAILAMNLAARLIDRVCGPRRFGEDIRIWIWKRGR